MPMPSAEQNDSNTARLNYDPGEVAKKAHKSSAQVKLAWGPRGTAKTTEPSAHRLTAATKLRDCGYPGLYYTSQLDTRTKRSVQRLGWINTSGRKAVMIDTLADLVGFSTSPQAHFSIEQKELLTLGLKSSIVI